MLPGYNYVIADRGEVEVGDLSCASCHTRLMHDGSVLKGAPDSVERSSTCGIAWRVADSLLPRAVPDSHRRTIEEFAMHRLNTSRMTGSGHSSPWARGSTIRPHCRPHSRRLVLSVVHILYPTG
jgi:hypothetical protein